MDATVPLAAARLLDFIREIEVGTDDRESYDVIYGFNQEKLPKPVTSMTVDEVLASQVSWTKRFGSSATGGYQFMKATLTDLKRELGLSGGQVMEPNLQDRLGYHLLKRRGYTQFVAGSINRAEFGKRLAMEWASLPVLAATQGAHRSLSRGQSYYAGDKLNKSLVSAERFEGVLDEALALARGAAEIAVPAKPPVPVARPEPIITPETTMPAEGTPGSPVEKAIGAGKGSATGSLVGGAAGALVIVAVQLGWIPEAADTAIFGAAVATVLTSFASFVMAVVGAYRAPRNAEPGA